MRSAMVSHYLATSKCAGNISNELINTRMKEWIPHVGVFHWQDLPYWKWPMPRKVHCFATMQMIILCLAGSQPMGRKMVDCMNLPKGIYVSALFLYKCIRGNSYTVYKREKLEISIEHFSNINFLWYIKWKYILHKGV